jgi:hypothetical protein
MTEYDIDGLDKMIKSYALALRIRDLEAINNELDRMLKLVINKREPQDLQSWVDENINPTDDHASPTNP